MKYLVDKQLILDLIADLGPGDAYAEITKEFLAVQKEYETSMARAKKVDTLRKALVEYLGEDTDRVDAIIKELDTPVVNCSSVKSEGMNTNSEVKVRVVKNGIRDVEEEDRILKEFLGFFD